MLRLLVAVILLLVGATKAQVPTANYAGKWNVFSPDYRVTISFLYPHLTASPNYFPTSLAGRYNRTAGWIYVWSSKTLRDHGDTTMALAGLRGGCITSTSLCTATLSPRGSGAVSVSFQIVKTTAPTSGVYDFTLVQANGPVEWEAVTSEFATTPPNPFTNAQLFLEEYGRKAEALDQLIRSLNQQTGIGVVNDAR